jgi:ribosomal protein S18 acetylase RimI-like enzyme
MEQELKLQAMLVTSPVEAEVVRLIRNQCRMHMTRDTSEIGPAQQQRWWASLDSSSKLFLFYVHDWTEYAAGVTAVGYGLCRSIGGKWWLSGGLATDWQGKGLGKALFARLVEEVGTPCWLEVLEHNTRAFNTYRELGFVEVSRTAGIVTMEKH